MNAPTLSQVYAIGRHVATAVGSIAATLTVLNIMSTSDSAATSAALDQIGVGVKSIIAGITALIPVVSALYATWSASPLAQMLSASKVTKEQINASPQMQAAAVSTAAKVEQTTVVTKPEIAAMAPANVLPVTDVKVIDKGSQE